MAHLAYMGVIMAVHAAQAHMPSDRNVSVRLLKRAEQSDAGHLENTTAAQRIGAMWQLALDAWAFKGEPVAEPRLPRHATRLLRGRC